ncbi:MAG: hypothetical protein JWN20_1642, partial [Jatrophihabitantaceae bacterium]|nr:hypothetical protein [Jatrophihabitantaceae bacterium]
ITTCSFGAAPCPLNVIPSDITIEGKPAATIMDNKPPNLATFGVCMSLSNPMVAAATAAALGVLTPMPCVPVIAAPWVPPAAQTLLGGKPALAAGAQCMCNWGGVVQIGFTGAVRTTVA